MRNARLTTPKYSRVVVRIAEREGISPARAVTLYRRAFYLGIRDYSKGLAARVEKKLAEHESYWDEKRKDRREEFLEEDAVNAERAFPTRRPS